MEKLVSIVLPVYNGEEFLAQSIESVLNQTYKNIELIIINDCSIDSTEDIVLKYKAIDDRVKYYKNIENLKLPRSLNKGFSLANGEYYTWTSDDNYYELNAIEKMVAYLENNPDKDMVCCDYHMYYITSGIKTDRIIFQGNILCGNNIGACFLYTRYIAKKVGEYNADLFLVEDYDYWIRIFLNGEIGCIHEFLYNYRFHEKSLSISRRNEIKKIDINYKLSMLPTYEKASIDKRMLFDFFDYLRGAIDEKKQKRKLLIRLFFRHPIYILKRIINKVLRIVKK